MLVLLGLRVIGAALWGAGEWDECEECEELPPDEKPEELVGRVGVGERRRLSEPGGWRKASTCRMLERETDREGEGRLLGLGQTDAVLCCGRCLGNA
jgi:hypothetical protein